MLRGLDTPLYKDAPFIVLDEPTAALDPVSEYEVYSRFNAIAGDKIAVFDAGQIVQSGRHEDLLADTSGQYHALWTAQALYYTNEPTQ